MHLKLMKISLLLTLVVLLAVGCAKKPIADDSKVAETEMQQDTISTVDEQPVMESSSNTKAESAVADSQTTMDQAINSLMRVNFEFDQYVLTADARETLKKNAAYLQAKGVRVQIEGHCDERGSDEYNLALGEKRALAVKNYLVALGVPADRMSIISYGEEIPLVMASNEAAWSQNRRAEFKELN